MNNIVFVPSFSSKPFKHCPSFLHITFSHTFFLYQISVFELLSGCFSGDTFCDGLKWYRFFFRVIFNNHVLLHYVGPGWFFSISGWIVQTLFVLFLYRLLGYLCLNYVLSILPINLYFLWFWRHNYHFLVPIP